MKLSTKLIVVLLLVGILPFATMGTVSLIKSQAGLKSLAFNQLNSVQSIKKAQIETFFGEREGDIGVLQETVATLRQEAFMKLEMARDLKSGQIQSFFAERMGDAEVLADNPHTQTAYLDLLTAFAMDGGASSGNFSGSGNYQYNAPAGYKAVHDKHFDTFDNYMRKYGYFDLFLMDAEKGAICFSVFKEGDFGRDTSQIDAGTLRDAWEHAKNGNVWLSDMAPYAPSADAPAQFVAAPIKDQGSVIGVVALQISTDAINKIMGNRAGLGETGETYLVGQDYLMRSDSYLDPENHSIVASFKDPVAGKAKTEASKAALSGSTDSKVILDYFGNPVLSCWAPISVGNQTWGLLAEIDVAEAFCPKDEKGEYFFAKYIKMYGYYDLFLMNPDGYTFYTVTQEADYQTNFVDGKYANSNLGELVRDVIRTKEFGIADFAPYAPSNGDPAAFIAQPVIHSGEVELIVGLQLSLEAINGIMQQRDGMGQSGESYLVGQDLKMRSDSFLDPTNFSVVGSFANNNSAKSEQITEALAGKSGQLIGPDYTKVITGKDNIVLAAYSPVKAGDLTWALVAEIDRPEAFAAADSLKRILIILSLIGTLTILVVAILLSRSITGPISRVISGMQSGSEEVNSAAGQVASASTQLAEGASEQASNLEETAATLEVMSSSAKTIAEQTQNADDRSSTVKDQAERGKQAMVSLNNAMEKIKESSSETAKIIKTIDEIAFQTNLLALNAAVEAARAGDAGKGFAVVAEEVRNLAQRSAEAAKGTANLIDSSVENSNLGASATQEVSEILEDVVEGIVEVSGLIGEVSKSAGEQARNVQGINSSVGQLDSVTQSNAAGAEESASAAEEMSAQANEMQSLVQRLVTIISGASAGRPSYQPNSGSSGSSGGPIAKRIMKQPEAAAQPVSEPFGNSASGDVVIPLDEDCMIEL